MNVEHDRLFKQLLSNFFDSFVDAFLPEIGEYIGRAATYTELKTELFSQGGRHRSADADLVFKVDFRQQEKNFLIHVETQATYERDFGARLLKYNALLLEKYKLPIYSVVIFSFLRPTKLQPDVLSMSFGALRGLNFPFKVVQLNRLSWRDYTNKQNPVVVALLSKMMVALEERVAVKLQCMRELVALQLGRKQEAIVWEFIDTYLVLSEWEEDSYEDALAALSPAEGVRMREVRMSWKQRDLMEGRELGKAEAKAVSLEIVSRLLTQRVGVLAPSTQESLKLLSDEQLLALTDSSPKFNQQADLTAWLAAQKKKS